MKASKNKSGNGTDEVYKSDWEHYDDLKFLIPTLVVREGTDSLDTQTESGDTPNSSISSIPTPETPATKNFGKKRMRIQASDDDTKEQLSESVKAAREVLENLKPNAESNILPPDVKGFIMTLGSDLGSIHDIKTRKFLMMDIQRLVVDKMFPIPTSATHTATSQRVTNSEPQTSTSSFAGVFSSLNSCSDYSYRDDY